MAKTVVKKVQDNEQFITIPRSLLCGFFDQVAYRKDGKEIEVVFKFLIPPTDEWNTVTAIDFSESMRSLFGKTLTGDVPLDVQERYYRQNFVFEETREGKVLRFYQPEAYDDAIAKGYLKWTDNEIEPKAREILGFLGKQIDVRESCNLMYWGFGKGLGWVDFGEISAEESDHVAVSGPEPCSFGSDSKLLPVLQYLVAKFIDVPRTMVVILTDGHFSDVEDVKTFCISLALLIKAGQRNFMKFVFVGMGKDIDQKILAEFAGMKIGPTAELFDYKLVDDIKEVSEILGGIVSEDEMVAPKAVILDSKGNLVKEYPDGLPGNGSFRMPIDSPSFTFKFSPGDKKIQQSLLLPFRKSLL